MKEMVVGFYYNTLKSSIVLIRKNKPEWQNGLFNGIGGKIEDGESPYHAMKREFIEEANLLVYNWKHFVTITNFKDKSRVYFFCTFGSLEGIESVTDEIVSIFDINYLPENMIPNLRWLIPLGIDCLENNYTPIDITIN